MPKVRSHSVTLSGLQHRLAILGVKRLKPRTWDFVVHCEKISDKEFDPFIAQKKIESFPKDRPIVAVACPASASPVERAIDFFTEMEREVADGKRAAFRFRAGDYFYCFFSS